MALTEVQICNMALSRVGVKASLITSLSDNSREAQLCNLIFATHRDRLLETAHWPFAEKRGVLLNQTILTGQQFAYEYSAPTDMAKPIQLEDTDNVAQVVELLAYHQRGTKILSNKASAVLIYTAYITDASLFSYSFGDVLAWSLATELCAQLGAPPDMIARNSQLYQMHLQIAKAGILNTNVPQAPTESEFIRARN